MTEREADPYTGAPSGHPSGNPSQSPTGGRAEDTRVPAGTVDLQDPGNAPGPGAAEPRATAADGRVGGPPRRAVGAAADGPASAARRDTAVRAAVARGLVSAQEPIVALLDVVGIRAGVRDLRNAFAEVAAPGTPVLHTFAVKAAPLVPVLRLLRDEGVGAEVASPGELALARAAGVAARQTVLDSPAKTESELREALTLGIAVNADNFQELARLDALVATLTGMTIAADTPEADREPGGARRLPPLGLRVNPQIGGGSIDALSTATPTSKFGVALKDPGARERVVRAVLARPWLTRLHTHTGSQGLPLALMAQGVAQTYALAEEINTRAGQRRIDTIDIGGGLPVDFTSDTQTPAFARYARLLAREVPGLFDGRYGLVTEFGRSLLAKHGFVLARVEYTKSAGGRRIAVTHAGAQIAARTVYAPAQWPLRIAAYDERGRPSTTPVEPQDIAGPACFAGDLLAEGRPLPRLAPGHHIAALDTGAYYFAHHYAYNSLARPAVHGFLIDSDRPGPDRITTPSGADDDASPLGVSFATVRPAQTIAEVVAEAGGAHAMALDF